MPPRLGPKLPHNISMHPAHLSLALFLGTAISGIATDSPATQRPIVATMPRQTVSQQQGTQGSPHDSLGDYTDALKRLTTDSPSPDGSNGSTPPGGGGPPSTNS